MAIKILLYDDNVSLRGSLGMLLNEEPDFELQAAMPDAETVVADINTENVRGKYAHILIIYQIRPR